MNGRGADSSASSVKRSSPCGWMSRISIRRTFPGETGCRPPSSASGAIRWPALFPACSGGPETGSWPGITIGAPCSRCCRRAISLRSPRGAARTGWPSAGTSWVRTTWSRRSAGPPRPCRCIHSWTSPALITLRGAWNGAATPMRASAAFPSCSLPRNASAWPPRRANPRRSARCTASAARASPSAIRSSSATTSSARESTCDACMGRSIPSAAAASVSTRRIFPTSSRGGRSSGWSATISRASATPCARAAAPPMSWCCTRWNRPSFSLSR